MTLLPTRFRSGLRRGAPLPQALDTQVSAPPPPPANSAGERPGPAPYHIPTAREQRAQAVQRLQVGLFGLAAMVLLVALAQIIMQHARSVDAAANAGAVHSAAPTNASDPLADIGVAPAQDAGNASGHKPPSHTPAK